RDACARIAHLATNDRRSRPLLLEAGADHDFAALRELDRIARQVEQDLPQAPRVAPQPARRLGVNTADQFQPLDTGRLGEQADRLLDGGIQVEVYRFQLQLTGLDLREIEDVVEDVEQGLGRRLGHVQVLALLGREVGVQGQLRHTEDAIHRRADLVAHVRQELALRPAGCLRRHFRLLQLTRYALLLGNISTRSEEETLAWEGRGIPVHPAIRAIPAAHAILKGPLAAAVQQESNL